MALGLLLCEHDTLHRLTYDHKATVQTPRVSTKKVFRSFCPLPTPLGVLSRILFDIWPTDDTSNRDTLHNNNLYDLSNLPNAHRVLPVEAGDEHKPKETNRVPIRAVDIFLDPRLLGSDIDNVPAPV